MFESLAHYKILDRIGAGGMGEVYRARDTRLGRTVAIKVLAADVANDPDRRDRFLREARAAAALSHPNIAALYEIGEDQGQLFLAFSTSRARRSMRDRRAANEPAAHDPSRRTDCRRARRRPRRGYRPPRHQTREHHRNAERHAKILDFGLATWTTGGAEREQAVDAATVMKTAAGTTLGTVASHVARNRRSAPTSITAPISSRSASCCSRC
jgi:serine/threonine-protein kinase